MIRYPVNLSALMLVIPYLFIMRAYKKCICYNNTALGYEHYVDRIKNLGLLALVLLVIGWSQPVIWQVKRTATVQNASLTIVLDVSNSMTMKGTSGTALIDAKKFIADLLQGEDTAADSGFLYSLIVFKGQASVLVPQVKQTAYILDALEWVTPASITGAGSALNEALSLVKTTVHNHQNSIVVICTDGTSSIAARELLDLYILGADIYIIGFGSLKPSVIYNSEGNIIKDYDGNDILLSRNRNNLALIAKRGHARYFDCEDTTAMNNILKSVTVLKKSQGIELVQQKPLIATPFFAFTAFCILAVAYIQYCVLHKKFVEML